ncbi:hypothetical protein N7468_005754 [Penicillium chermesinum]|uniref:Uncharacterized protein n=1 Tax=Penicillium chermesinum TaxID=63820 RepID=A0A9W9P2G3_9EURO|nr:uncharacterized protein N7468_005754 [Penicillium chermesinum]KAJ5232798.1 hypothetical protein N7468_005754 [Penicillium chermesinum]
MSGVPLDSKPMLPPRRAATADVSAPTMEVERQRLERAPPVPRKPISLSSQGSKPASISGRQTNATSPGVDLLVLSNLTPQQAQAPPLLICLATLQMNRSSGNPSFHSDPPIHHLLFSRLMDYQFMLQNTIETNFNL